MSRHHHTLRGHHLSSFFVFFMNSQISSTSTLVKLRFCRKYFVTSSQWVPAISSHFEIVSLSCPVALATPRMLPFSRIIASVLRTSSRGVSSPKNTTSCFAKVILACPALKKCTIVFTIPLFDDDISMVLFPIVWTLFVPAPKL